MKQTFTHFMLLSCLVLTSQCVIAADPSNLIKVNKEADQKCVEYYTYQGELYCATKAQNSQPIDPAIRNDETQKIVFDDRPWQPVWGQKTDQVITVEYVPMGDNIENWHELVTSQFFPGLQNKITPKEFADNQIENMKNSGFSPIVTFLKDTPDYVIFEFRIESPAAQIQDELQKITKGKDGLYVLHYVIKKLDMGQKSRELWANNLLKSNLLQSKPIQN